MKSRKGILSAIAVGLISCSGAVTPTTPLIDRLKNRGPIALNPENPYIAANQLLSKEMQASPELSGFIKHKGSPSAIAVEERMFEPLLLKLYYAKQQEFFEVEQEEGTWIIGGPYVIDEKDSFTVSEIARAETSPPPLAVEPQAPTPTELPTESPEIAPTSRPAPLPKHELPTRTPLPATPSPTVEETAPPTEVPTNAPPEGSFVSPATIPTLETKTLKDLLPPSKGLEGGGQDAGGHLAEITPRGDLVHYVTLPGETLAIIAKWYTQDRENAGRIGRLNKLKDPTSLAVGDTIVIPSYLVKNKTRLTEDAIKKLEGGK